MTAVRSVWASAFALDPLARLEASGLAPEALEMAVLIQPEIRPDCGGTARVCGGTDGTDGTVTVDGGEGTVTIRAPAEEPAGAFSAGSA